MPGKPAPFAGASLTSAQKKINSLNYKNNLKTQIFGKIPKMPSR
jgi:hypothetical protein